MVKFKPALELTSIPLLPIYSCNSFPAFPSLVKVSAAIILIMWKNCKMIVGLFAITCKLASDFIFLLFTLW